MSDQTRKRLVRPFDIFDTLVARKRGEPVDIFDKFEQPKVPNSKKQMLRAQAMSDRARSDIVAHHRHVTGSRDSATSPTCRHELQAENALTSRANDSYHCLRDGLRGSDVAPPAEPRTPPPNSIRCLKPARTLETSRGWLSRCMSSSSKDPIQFEKLPGANRVAAFAGGRRRDTPCLKSRKRRCVLIQAGLPSKSPGPYNVDDVHERA